MSDSKPYMIALSIDLPDGTQGLLVHEEPLPTPEACTALLDQLLVHGLPEGTTAVLRFDPWHDEPVLMWGEAEGCRVP